MKVSCICPTYNRVVSNKLLLEETVESFLRQDYEGDKELIIINDNPLQTIFFDHPQVKVINHPERFASLGAKYNYAISLSTGDYICTWEDDDISLSNRISKSIELIKDAEYFNPLAYFFMCGDTFRFEQGTGYSHNCSLYTKDAWLSVGGYPETSGPQDAQMDGLLRKKCKTISGPIDKKDAFFIYRWGVSDLHLSGNDDTEKAYLDYSKNATTGGVFTLHPKWAVDYDLLAKNCK